MFSPVHKATENKFCIAWPNQQIQTLYLTRDPTIFKYLHFSETCGNRTLLKIYNSRLITSMLCLAKQMFHKDITSALNWNYKYTISRYYRAVFSSIHFLNLLYHHLKFTCQKTKQEIYKVSTLLSWSNYLPSSKNAVVLVYTILLYSTASHI